MPIQTIQTPAVAPTAHAAGATASTGPRATHAGQVRSLDDLARLLPGQRLPPIAHGALPGEGVLAGHGQAAGASTLLSFGSAHDVVLTLYDERTRKGVVLHVDNNVAQHIDRAIAKALHHVEAAHHNSKVTASLFGGTWLTTHEDIGGAVRATLDRHGVVPNWDHWSFSMCLEHRYGTVLDLETGNVTVFEHSKDMADDFFKPLLQGAASGQGTEERLRSRWYEKRMQAPEIYETRGGDVRFSQGSRSLMTSGAVKAHQFLLRSLDAPLADSRSSAQATDSAANTDGMSSGMDWHASAPPARVRHASKEMHPHVAGFDFTVRGRERDRDQIRACVVKLRELESTLQGRSLREVRELLDELRQDWPGLRIDVRKPHAHDNWSDSSSSSNSLRQRLPPLKPLVRADASASGGDTSASQDEARPTLVRTAPTYDDQVRHLSAEQRKLLDVALERIQAGRGRAHPVYVNSFEGLSVREDIGRMFGQLTNKLYSTDLPNWEPAGGGRGAWRLVFKTTDAAVGVLGVFDTHQKPYRRWE